ncbi:MAG TPA: hypothetical protein VKB53_04210 [Gammaproteobacteria bacterium]|nr:hypothetical protein [Gammaproteobacteria bacterium]
MILTLGYGMDKRANIKVTLVPQVQVSSNTPLGASSNRSAAQIAPLNKCGFCANSTCCTYITQHIEAPRSKYDFEHLLWQVSHETIEAYNDEDGWCLLVETHCSHLERNALWDLCGSTADLPRSF